MLKQDDAIAEVLSIHDQLVKHLSMKNEGRFSGEYVGLLTVAVILAQIDATLMTIAENGRDR